MKKKKITLWYYSVLWRWRWYF